MIKKQNERIVVLAESTSLQNDVSLSIHLSMVNLVLPHVGISTYFRDFQKFVKSRKVGSFLDCRDFF